MADFLASLMQPVSEGGFLPHALCLSLDATLLWLHVASDTLIALSYYSIPVALIYFAYRRRDFSHRWLLPLFGAFITACGSVHLMHVWTLFQPDYWLEGWIKAVTAMVSVATAVVLWPMIPKLLALPSPAMLECEVIERRAAEAQVRSNNATLEHRVLERTAELEQARYSAERANVAKSKFLAAASHDLRQPVQALMNFMAALHILIKDEKARSALTDMDRSVAAIGMLLDSLLDISRLDAGIVQPQLQEFAIAPLIERMHKEFGPLATEKGVRLTAVPCAAIVRSDPALLSRIVQNLVANAVRYTDEGRILIGCRREGEALRICIHDTGLGIPDEKMADIFEEFTQLGNAERDRTKGLGLGLSIVDRLSRLLGHPLRLRSQLGSGSTFSLTVPLAGKAVVVARQGTLPRPPSASRPLTRHT